MLDPDVSMPNATTSMFDATATADPLLEPHGSTNNTYIKGPRYQMRYANIKQHRQMQVHLGMLCVRTRMLAICVCVLCYSGEIASFDEPNILLMLLCCYRSKGSSLLTKLIIAC